MVPPSKAAIVARHAADVGYLPEDRGLYRDQPILRTLVYLAALRGMPHEEARAEARR